MPASSQPLVLLLGMHRSGTSLLGSMLPACGIAMPGPLLAGDQHNPEGYFEHAAITALQEQLLIDLERWWPSPRGMEPLPSGWLESPLGERACTSLVNLLTQEQGEQSGPWAIKDPRSSLLLPLWRKACSRMGIPLELVLAVRDPDEVMVSLVRRDYTTTGMDPWRAQRLWWHHNRQVLVDSADLPLHVLSYSHWFEPDKARQQLQVWMPQLSNAALGAALAAVRSEHRRSLHHRPPLPVARPLRQLYGRLQRLALSADPQGRELLLQWLAKQPNPPALAPLPRRRSAFKRQVLIRLGRPPVNRVANHPWGYLAQVVCGSEGPAAEHQLSHWLRHGFRHDELERFASLPGPAPAAEPWDGSGGKVQLRGSTPLDWASHAWLQHCPIAAIEALVPLGTPGAAEVALNLASIEADEQGAQELLQLAQLERVWDPDADRVRQLRQFGIRASWLRPDQPQNDYLMPSANEPWAACGQELGLPAPTALTRLGSSLCLGEGAKALNTQLTPPLLGVPGFDQLKLHAPQQAKLLASWLQGCLSAGLELVRFNATPEEQRILAWQALWQEPGCPQAPVLLPRAPMEASELLDQLAWHRQGCPPPPPCTTPTPSSQTRLERRQGSSAIAVCVSLYNYGSRVLAALESVRHQQETEGLELIVVDDASTDGGATLVQSWMEQHHGRFSRCLLLQHSQNGGLAAARNTAFAAAESPWCFVLDADNSIDPLALVHLRAIAEQAAASCAVVHSLIRVHAEASSHDNRALVSSTPWQQAQLKHGNSIDAMALVRRSAWQAVGGYTHIPGGWEDYDFWCCLIDAGWHGVLCPQVLGTYTSHGSSMRSQTVSHTYRLSQLLQQRHPWLNIAQAADQTAGTGQRSNRGGQAST